MSEILVIGTAERDTIIHTESRRLRSRLGGVGAIVAEELARLNYNVTMLAPLAMMIAEPSQSKPFQL